MDEELKQLYGMVNVFARAMRKRLKEKYLAGYKGWDWDRETVRWKLGRAIRRKRWVDAANLAAMLDYMDNKERKQTTC